MISRRIGRYEIDRLLGEGGVGRVYAAHDTLLGRQVAIKTLRPEANRNREALDRFFNEAKTSSDLRHPNIVTVYDLVEDPTRCIIMEFVEGHTLEELLLECGRLPPRECLAVVAQVAAGLSAAHRKGVIHRDIKPSNLMVTESGLLKIMDFGIARVRGSQRLTRADQVYATLLYASPEQLRGAEVDERSDVYSLAAVTYEMLAGSPPFTADTDADLRMAQLEAIPPPLAPLVPGLAPRIEAGVLRALAKRPGDRFATVEAFADAVGASAIRREAAEILQGHLVAIRRRLAEPSGTRLIRARPRSTLAKEPTVRARYRGTTSTSSRTDDSLAVKGGARIASLRGPISVLAGTALVLGLGIGYLVWSPTTPVIKSAEEPTPPPASPWYPDRGSQERSAPPLIPPHYVPPPDPTSPSIRPPDPRPFPLPDAASPRLIPPAPLQIPPPKQKSAILCGQLVNYAISNTDISTNDTLLGAWSGTWNNPSKLCGSLIVKNIDRGGRAELEYRYGQGNSPREMHVSGLISGNATISFLDDQGSTFEFSRAGNVLQAKFSSRSGALSAIFTRVGGE